MNERKLLGLLALAKDGATEGERSAARNALREYIGPDDDAVVQAPQVVAVDVVRPSVTWRQPALKLGLFMAVACIAVSTGTGTFWTLVIGAVCAKMWDPEV